MKWQNIYQLLKRVRVVVVDWLRKFTRKQTNSPSGNTPAQELPVVTPEEGRPKINKKQEFISSLSVLTEQGFDPLIVFTHAYHESANFKKVIGNFNFWGIKKPKKWAGKTIDVITHEYINGKKEQVTDTFIDFATVESALLWYGDLIYRLYETSYANRTDYKKYFEGLVSGKYKYASDPLYVNKLINLHHQLCNVDKKDFWDIYNVQIAD